MATVDKLIVRIEADLKSKTPYPRLRELRRIEQ